MDRVLDDAIGAANSLFTGSRICSDAPPTLAQRSALQHMEDCVTSLGPPPLPQDPGAPRRMLSEVLAASSTYGDGNHVQPYQKDLVSWAPAGFVPVPIEKALSEPDREWFGKWATHLLVPPAEAAAAAAESGLERPHMDPQLSHNANTYADFLRRLHEAGMLRWKRTEQKKQRFSRRLFRC